MYFSIVFYFFILISCPFCATESSELNEINVGDKFTCSQTSGNKVILPGQSFTIQSECLGENPIISIKFNPSSIKISINVDFDVHYSIENIRKGSNPYQAIKTVEIISATPNDNGIFTCSCKDGMKIREKTLETIVAPGAPKLTNTVDLSPLDYHHSFIEANITIPRVLEEKYPTFCTNLTWFHSTYYIQTINILQNVFLNNSILDYLHELNDTHHHDYHIVYNNYTISNEKIFNSKLSFETTVQLGGYYIFNAICYVGPTKAIYPIMNSWQLTIPPGSIHDEPLLYRSHENNDAELFCPIHGFPLPTIIWIKDDNIISELTDTRYTFQDYNGLADGHFLIHDAKTTDSAKYTCVGESSIGSFNVTLKLGIRSKHAVIWPSIGIGIQFLFILIVILITSKRFQGTKKDE